MKKRILSIVLAICLVLSCVPITVFAADVITPGFTSEFLDLVNGKESVKLDRNYILPQGCFFGKNFTLDLNGYFICLVNENSRLSAGHKDWPGKKTLTIKDSRPSRTHSTEEIDALKKGGATKLSLPNNMTGGVITSNDGSVGAAGVLVRVECTLNFESGTIYNCDSTTSGGGVYVDENCTFNMTGGTIVGCTAANGGGAVFVNKGGTFNMKGGTIDGCTAAEEGGAVFVDRGGTFNMSNGTISNCKARGVMNKEVGGAAYINVGGTFTMSGGTIQNCTAYYGAGGVYNDGIFTMSGGTIDNCSAENAGGVSNMDTFNMTNGTIKNCDATNGGAVITAKSFTMSGGVIDNCKADNKGGGVTVMSDSYTNGIFTLDGGTIKNCSALFGGGVANGFDSLYNAYFTMNSGTIDNCQAKKNGGGVYNEDYTVSTLNGGTIKNCVAFGGGGVAVSRNASYTSSGELILENSASNELSKFNMYGGTIENCRAINYNEDGTFSIGCGGGVSVFYGKFTMTSGTIKNCTARDNRGDAIWLFSNSDMIADGGSVYGNCFVDDHYFNTVSEITNTNYSKYTKFYGLVENQGTISGGVFYGGIKNTQNKKGVYGNVTSPFKIVTFDSNGGSSVPAQWLVNAKGATANRPTDPTKENSIFIGWYKGDNEYDFSTAVPENTIGFFTLEAKWVNTNVSTEAELKEALDAGATSIKLVSDFELLSTLDLSDKDITLDLNGHVLKGNIKLSDTYKPINPSKLTLIDSNPTATHTNSNLPLGGVLDGEIKLDKKTFGSLSRLCANGGTVTGQVILNDSNTQIVCTSTTPTAFMDYVKGSGGIYGGMFYGGVKQGCIEEKTVTFFSDGQYYAVGVVEIGKNAVAPIEPVKDGYVFAGWYIGNTKYNFQQPVMQDVVLNAKWANEVTDEETLRAAINEGITTIKLMADINLSSALDLSQKDITIDLNGYVISGADISINTGNGQASLTLKDSRPTATHTDSTLPKGGVVTSKISMMQNGGGYNNCVLYANGGTVTSEFSTNTNAVAIKCTSNTPTAFTEKISGYAHLYGGIYYGTVNSSVTFEESKITFKNGDSNYAYEVLSSDKKSIEPISPSVMTGYQAFDGWYNGNTKYTFGSSLSQDITLTAKYKNPLTYNISYNLGGGTATNPTSYTVESDAIKLINPVKTGYTFTGWSGTGLPGENNMAVTIAKGSTGDRAYTAHFSQNSYTVAFDTVGGSSISDKAGVTWTDTVLSGITAPTKDGWEFTGWKCGDKTVNANTKYSDLAANDTVTSVTLVAQWKDTAAPTGEISIGTNKWNSFINTITFGLFFKDTQTVTITATDNSGDAVTIEYLLSDKELDETELASATFTAYTEAFSINPDNKYVVYARLTDHAGNVTYISSEGVVLDATTPVISGVENGKTYCEAQTVTVTEEYIESVKVNGTAVTLDANNQFTLNPAEGTQTIVATDKAGNVSAEITVTVNNGHTAGNDDGDCSTPVYCIYHPNTVVVAAKSHDFSGEWHNDGTGHWHICQNDGCTVAEPKASHFGTDDGNCTTAVICECGYTITAANADHTYGEWQSNGGNTHTRNCTVTGCNGYEDGDCAGGAATYFNKAVCDECNEAYGELLTDTTAPTGEISIGTNEWNSFLNTITFGLFFKDTQSVAITATDDSYNHDGYTEDKAVKVEYLLSDKELDETELASATFAAYTEAFSINPDNKYVVYAKLTDHAGNVTYISSEGVVLDASAPVISGVENGKTYCEAQTVTVTEEYIESVKVNGTAVTLDENNQFTLNPSEGTQTIVATDKAGNVSAEITVTVNNGHTYEWQDDNGQYRKKCKFCDDETAKKDIPTFAIDSPDKVCRTQDCEASVTLPDGITDAVLTYEFIGLGGAVDTTVEDGKLYAVVTANSYPNVENSFNLVAYATTPDGFPFTVSKTVQIQNEHAGGVATCIELAICDTCGEHYGELDSANHNLEKISAKAATVTETGNTEYWHCTDCGKYFADENGKTEIKLDDTVISKLPPEIIKGTGQSITEGEKKELSFTSNAALGDFIRAQLDGKTLDTEKYTAKEGSTIITLKADYVATLSAGEHTIGIVSESGTATTTFTVDAKAVEDASQTEDDTTNSTQPENNDTKSPQTGDNSHMTLWIALLFVSGGLMAVTGGYSKKKKHG